MFFNVFLKTRPYILNLTYNIETYLFKWATGFPKKNSLVLSIAQATINQTFYLHDHIGKVLVYSIILHTIIKGKVLKSFWYFIFFDNSAVGGAANIFETIVKLFQRSF